VKAEKFLQLGFAGALDIPQRVLFKKSHNGHFANNPGKLPVRLWWAYLAG